MEYVTYEEPGERDFNCGKAQPGGNRVCAPYGGADFKRAWQLSWGIAVVSFVYIFNYM